MGRHEWGSHDKPKEAAMFHDPETHRSLARQRERELIENANRERLARRARQHGSAARASSHGRSGDTKRRDER